MSLSLKERNRRFSAIREQMAQNKLDGLIIAGREGCMTRGNIRYITGYGIIAGEQYCIFRSKDDPVFIGGKSPAASRMSNWNWPLDVRIAADAGAQAVKELTDLDNGRQIGIVGMQDISVPAYLLLKEKFGNRLVDATDIFKQLRLIKSTEEIEKMRVSAAIADRIYQLIMEMLQPGLSGHEICALIKKTTFEMGCEYSFDILSTQGTSMNLYYPTGDRLIKNGILGLEISPAYEGYFAQLPVTLPVGEFPSRLKKVLPVWKQALKEATGILGPGVKVAELYQAVARVIRKSEFVSPWRPGHAIGLDLIDFWSIGENNNTVLQPGMTIALHPNVMYEPDVEGIGIGGGYTYLITTNGYEQFSKIDITG
jgi:Xaa-Pro aminopeptidase